MKKRTRMHNARPARQKIMTLPDIPAYLESELNAAKKELGAFLVEYKCQPMKWGLAPFEGIVRPYIERLDLAEQRVQDYLDKPENYLTANLASLALEEFREIILSEHRSRIGKQPRESARPSEDGVLWDSERIAQAARIRGYASAPDKDSIVKELVSRSGKSEITVRRALRKHGLSGSYRRNG